jgi:hypothetical protein
VSADEGLGPGELRVILKGASGPRVALERNSEEAD